MNGLNKNNNHIRILYLRSFFAAAASIANGLINNEKVDFVQYPPWPSKFLPIIKKMEDPDKGWKDLNTNLISNKNNLWKEMSKGSFDLILFCDYHGQLTSNFIGTIFNNLIDNKKINIIDKILHQKRIYKYIPYLSMSLNELRQIAPIAAIDIHDYSFLQKHGIIVLEECNKYFKRELPYDRFSLFHPYGPVRWRKKTKELLPLVKKIHAIPLGITDDKFNKLNLVKTHEKSNDIFWAGGMTNSMRFDALKYLNNISKRKKWKIIVADKPIPFGEYCKTIAKSKITISIAGGGWDCDRHYEAVALGSLPLINKPTVDKGLWQEMPRQIFFENDFTDFEVKIEQLLNDNDLWSVCHNKMNEVIKENMLWSKIIDFIADKTIHNKT